MPIACGLAAQEGLREIAPHLGVSVGVVGAERAESTPITDGASGIAMSLVSSVGRRFRAQIGVGFVADEGSGTDEASTGLDKFCM